MKVYALREKVNNTWYMPIRGFFTSLIEAKKQGREIIGKAAEWDVALYLVPNSVSLADWVDLLNGDSLSSSQDGKVPRDFLDFQEVAFQTPAMKRAQEEAKVG